MLERLTTPPAITIALVAAVTAAGAWTVSLGSDSSYLLLVTALAATAGFAISGSV